MCMRTFAVPYQLKTHPFLSTKCMVAHRHTHTHAHTCTNMHRLSHRHMHAHTPTHTPTHTHRHTHRHTHTHTHTCTHSHTQLLPIPNPHTELWWVLLIFLNLRNNYVWLDLTNKLLKLKRPYYQCWWSAGSDLQLNSMWILTFQLLFAI